MSSKIGSRSGFEKIILNTDPQNLLLYIVRDVKLQAELLKSVLMYSLKYLKSLTILRQILHRSMSCGYSPLSIWLLLNRQKIGGSRE